MSVAGAVGGQAGIATHLDGELIRVTKNVPRPLASNTIHVDPVANDQNGTIRPNRTTVEAEYEGGTQLSRGPMERNHSTPAMIVAS